MTPFEYITVLISIILGLGITQIISGIADLVHNSARVRIYWPHILLILLVFFLQVQEWWAIYDLKTHGAWRLPVFLFVSLYPIILFILARILFPFGITEAVIDLRKFYFDNFQRFYFFISLSAVIAGLENVFIHDLPATQQVLQLFIFTTSSLIVIKRYKQEWIHYSYITLLVIVMLASFVVAWNEYLLE
jgi:hypothetical protein